MNTLTLAQFRKAVPLCTKPGIWVPHLNDAMALYGISDDKDYMVEFLAQCAHESMSFNRLEERLNYGAARLMQVWPKRFPTMEIAQQYEHKPDALGNFVYGGRMGNTDPGDGWKYRGRGIPMITGLDNYKRVSEITNDPAILIFPDRLTLPSVAAMAGAAWWAANPKLNALADDTATDDDQADFVSITRIVNGGTEGLVERAKFRAAFKTALLG